MEYRQMKRFIFFGAGRFAKINVDRWISEGIVPVCFVDNNKEKHYKHLESKSGERFKILPLKEALSIYPEANICITVVYHIPQVYYSILAEGVESSRIYRLGHNGIQYFQLDAYIPASRHCPRIGRDIVFEDGKARVCCMPVHSVFSIRTGNTPLDVEQYKSYCRELVSDLNEGKLTDCAGCPNLLDGFAREEKIEIKSVVIGVGVVGGRDCNAKCMYCVYVHNTPKTWECGGDNALDILKYMSEIPSVTNVSFSAAEPAISPYINEIVALWNEKKWKGELRTNGIVFIEGLHDLLKEGCIKLNISLDAGTAATFAKIKGVNKFNQVVSNIEKYAS